ncbi:MAG TPA: hypothetical protein QGF58_21775 [Myxococcota bacterium]|nr:hypothetical protein [Myxococcota bacterium]
MKLPESARTEFDALVTAPLRSTRQVIRSLEPALEEADGDAEAVIAGTLAQLGRLERKSSPLYVRLVHALAAYVLLPDRDWAVVREVHDTVARNTKRFELTLG